jgi:hypothetical protein
VDVTVCLWSFSIKIAVFLELNAALGNGELLRNCLCS